MNIIKIHMRIHRIVTDRIAVDGKVLHSVLIKGTAVLPLELAERQRDECGFVVFATSVRSTSKS
jgi:hypothetical protein